MAWGVVASLLAHVGVLIPGMDWPSRSAHDVFGGVPRPMAVRVVAADPSTPGLLGESAAAEPVEQVEQVERPPQGPPSDQVHDMDRNATSGHEARSETFPGGRDASSAALESKSVAEPARVLPMVDGYVLREALSTPPVPRTEVRLAWPAGWFRDGRQAGKFTVFIDDEGRVQRMVIDGPTLAPDLEEAAQSAFMSTRFVPGQVDGRAVKSLIRIEVVFDDATPVAAAASAPPTPPRIVSRQNL